MPTRLGFLGQTLLRTDTGNVSRVAPCSSPAFPCPACIDELAPPFVEVSLQLKTGGSPPLSDGTDPFETCVSCESWPSNYLLRQTESFPGEYCYYELFNCQCVRPEGFGFEKNIPYHGKIEFQIGISGSDIILTVIFSTTIRQDAGGPQLLAIFNKTIPNAVPFDCLNLNEVLDPGYYSQHCVGWEEYEVVVQTYPGPYEDRGADCPHCVWGTASPLMEFRMLGEMGEYPGASPCECNFPDEWIPLDLIIGNCCVYANTDLKLQYPGICWDAARLHIENDGYRFILQGNGPSTLIYTVDIFPPFDCTQTYSLTYSGGGSPCPDFEDVTIQVRPATPSFTFRSFESDFQATLGIAGTLSQEHVKYEQNYSGDVIVAGDKSQEHSKYEQSWAGQTSILGPLDTEHNNFTLNYNGSVSTEIKTATVELEHSSFESSLAGEVVPVISGSLSCEHSSFETSSAGDVTTSGDLSTEHSSYEQNHTAAVAATGDFSLTHSTYELNHAGNIEIVIEGTLSTEFRKIAFEGAGTLLGVGSFSLTHETYEQDYTAWQSSSGPVSLTHSTYDQSWIGGVQVDGVHSQEFKKYDESWNGSVISEGPLSQQAEFEQQWFGSVQAADPCNLESCIYECQGGGQGWVLIQDCVSVECVCPPGPPPGECIEGVNEGEQRAFNCSTN